MYWQYNINNSSSGGNLWWRKKSPFEHSFKMYFECAGFCWLFSRALIISNGTYPMDDGVERQEFNTYTPSHTHPNSGVIKQMDYRIDTVDDNFLKRWRKTRSIQMLTKIDFELFFPPSLSLNRMLMTQRWWFCKCWCLYTISNDFVATIVVDGKCAGMPGMQASRPFHLMSLFSFTFVKC